MKVQRLVTIIVTTILLSGCAALENAKKPSFNSSSGNTERLYETVENRKASPNSIMKIDAWIQEHMW